MTPLIFRNTILVLIATLMLGVVGYGQRTVGDIEGTITDQQGSVVPGITVNVTGISVGLSRTVLSDAQGKFRLSQIPAGVYKITTSAAAGFEASVADNVTVTIEKSTFVNLKLGLTAATESVVVTSDALGVNLDVTDSKVHTNITRQQIDMLPKGTSLQSILAISPATRAEPMSGGMQVDGASGSENTFMLDGIAMENFRSGALTRMGNQVNNIPTSMIAEVQVKTGGFEAEHGGASGGVIVVQTKQGTNAFHGDFSSEFTPSALQAGPRNPILNHDQGTNTIEDFQDNPDYTYLLRQKRDKSLSFYPTATVSGPIIKNRLWFLSTYSPQITRNTRVSEFIAPIDNDHFSTGVFVPKQMVLQGKPVDPITYKSMTKNEYSFSRVDTQITEKLRGTTTFLWNPQVNTGNLPYDSITSTEPSTTKYQGTPYTSKDYNRLKGGRINSNSFTGQLTYNPTSNLIGTFRFGRIFMNEKGDTYAIDSQVRSRCRGAASGYVYNTGCVRNFQNITNNSPTLRDVSVKKQFNYDLSYIPGSFAGRHEFKGGYEHGSIMNDVDTGNSGTGIVNLFYGQNAASADSGNGLGYAIPCVISAESNCIGVGRFTRFGTKGIGRSSFKGFYIQDKWQPTSRLSINAGVRLEKEVLPSFNTGQVIGSTPVPGIEIGWGSKIAPRFGGAYDLFGNGKTKIFASYGQFYDRMRFQLPRGSFGGDFFRVDYFTITKDHPEYTYYTRERLLGNFKDPVGGGIPSAAGGLSQFQRDNRIPSNLTKEQFLALGLVPTGVDPNIKSFRQDEITVGFERELTRLLLLSVRFTRKNVAHALEDHAILGINEAENYPIGNPGEGFALELDKKTGYVKSGKAQRLYRALELVVQRRLANNYFFSANYTLAGLYGNYSGLASSDEGGRVDPGVTRAFDYAINGYTATGNPDNGYLATDRRHAFKANGGYTFDKWMSKKHSTDLSFFFSAFQGTQQTTFANFGNTSIPLSKRGDLGRTPAFTRTDIALTHKFKITERYRMSFNINLINAFNQNSITGVYTDRYRTTNAIAWEDIDPKYLAENQTLTKVMNQILNGQIGTVLTQLENGTLPSLRYEDDDENIIQLPNPHSSLYGKASGYQAGRSIRFGFKFEF